MFSHNDSRLQLKPFLVNSSTHAGKLATVLLKAESGTASSGLPPQAESRQLYGLRTWGMNSGVWPKL